MKLLVSGYYGFNNIGDEAILESIILGFRKIDLGIQVIPISRSNIFRVISALLSADGFMSGGGGLLQDKTSSRSLWYYLGLLKLAQFLGKKTFVFAQGIGPVKSRLNRFFLKSVLKKCVLITVRDKASHELIKSFNLKETRLVQTADPTFLLSPKIKEAGEIEYSKRPIIGISVRDSLGWDKLYPKVARVADRLIEKYNAQVVLIPFQWPQDIIACNHVIRLVKNKVTLLSDAYNSREMLGVIGSLDLLLGMRLHSLIFAALGAVPAFGISYDPKVKNFMDEVSLPWTEVDQFDPDDVIDKITQLLDNKVGVKKSLDLIKQEICVKSMDNFKLVASLLK